MANSSVSGKLGTVTGVTGVSEITRWNAAIASDALDATSINSAGWREFILGLQGATGSLSAFGNAAPTIPTDGSPTVTLSLVTDSGSSVTVAGDAILNNINIESTVEGVVTFTADYTFTGQVTAT